MGKSDSDSSSSSGKRQTKAEKQRKMLLDAVPDLVKIIDDDIGDKTIKKFTAALAKVYDKAHKPTVTRKNEAACFKSACSGSDLTKSFTDEKARKLMKKARKHCKEQEYTDKDWVAKAKGDETLFKILTEVCDIVNAEKGIPPKDQENVPSVPKSAKVAYKDHHREEFKKFDQDEQDKYKPSGEYFIKKKHYTKRPAKDGGFVPKPPVNIYLERCDFDKLDDDEKDHWQTIADQYNAEWAKKDKVFAAKLAKKRSDKQPVQVSSDDEEGEAPPSPKPKKDKKKGKKTPEPESEPESDSDFESSSEQLD